jgi:hypothetical protein
MQAAQVGGIISESLAGSSRNDWRDQIGMGGGIKSEWVALSARNPHSGHGIPNADATTWSRGKLHRIDTTEPFEWIAVGGYSLLLPSHVACLSRKRVPCQM